MRSLRAIAAGSLFILVTLMLLQLAYIFITVGYNRLAIDLPWLKDHIDSEIARYLIGTPVLAAVMFAGGYLTALLARRRVLQHCLAVVVVVLVATLYPVLQDEMVLTATGVAVIILTLVATLGGGLYWQRQQERPD